MEARSPLPRFLSRDLVVGTSFVPERLVPFVRGNGEVKAGFRKVIFEVRVGIAVVVTRRGGVEKLSGEHAGIPKAKVQSFIHFVFGNRIQFVADVPARPGVGGNRNCTTAGVEIVL